MAEIKTEELAGEVKSVPVDAPDEHVIDTDPAETAEWLDSLGYVLESKGRERAAYLLAALERKAVNEGVHVPVQATTPYINTIPRAAQPAYPGNRELERRIKSIIRWNAMAMVVRANREADGIGGHISSFASSATLYEVALNHFFRGRGDGYDGDVIYFQGHVSPGVYARAYLEGRRTEQDLNNFRRELEPRGGLSSYPHPWLMPRFWEFPTVSMGLAPIMAIYQARFNEYLADRGLKNTKATGQLDFRRQLQSAAARWTRSREREDHSGTRRYLSRCRVERDQGRLGRRLGSAA